MTKWLRNLSGKVAAAVCALAFLGAAAAPSTASAGIGNIIGAVVGGGVAVVQVNQTIHYYNETEEGRQELLQAYEQKLGVNQNYYYNQMLTRIMTNLTAAISEVDPTILDKPYYYFVNNDESFNAFCSMGHVMSVNTGAFTTITNEDELAVVLGHEMGHGQKNHVAKGMRQRLLPYVAASAAGGTLAASVLANLVNNQGITKPMEREADALSFEYITHSNYNPGATAAVWQHVIDRSKDSGESLLVWAYGGSDHPSDASRRDTYEKSLAKYSGNHVTMDESIVLVNKKEFVNPAPSGDMSARERAYFVMGNLAAAYHNGHEKEAVTVEGATVKLGVQPIITCVAGDEAPDVLAERLKKIK